MFKAKPSTSHPFNSGWVPERAVFLPNGKWSTEELMDVAIVKPVDLRRRTVRWTCAGLDIKTPNQVSWTSLYWRKHI